LLPWPALSNQALVCLAVSTSPPFSPAELLFGLAPAVILVEPDHGTLGWSMPSPPSLFPAEPRLGSQGFRFAPVASLVEPGLSTPGC